MQPHGPAMPALRIHMNTNNIISEKQTNSEEQSARPWAVVTGASSGIGYELAKEFARNGFDLLIVAEDDGITKAAEDIRQLGAQVQPVQADLAKPEKVGDVYREILASARPLAAIALNAGVGAGGDFAREASLEKELNIVDLNVRS